jgi:hypothetical protein
LKLQKGIQLKENIKLILMIFAMLFLTSCASNGILSTADGILVSKNPGSVKNYSINDKGTVEIMGQKRITSMHWIYVDCDHWSGCYMRCQGQIDSCKQIAKDFKYIHSRPRWEK